MAFPRTFIRAVFSVAICASSSACVPRYVVRERLVEVRVPAPVPEHKPRYVAEPPVCDQLHNAALKQSVRRLQTEFDRRVVELAKTDIPKVDQCAMAVMQIHEDLQKVCQLDASPLAITLWIYLACQIQDPTPLEE